MIVRRERVGDEATVRSVVAAAFTRPDRPGEEPVEARLLDRLRADPAWLPKLSLVAEDPSGQVIGHVVCTRGTIAGAGALGLGPIGVRPDRQGAGIGSALMHAVLAAAEALDEPLVALLGSPDFYRRFGFRASTEFGIVPPDPAWGEYFQIRPLAAYRQMPGVFAYAEPFDRL